MHPYSRVLAGPDTFPRFWIFVYRLSPFTYLVDGMLSTGIANSNVVCSEIEYLHFNPLPTQNCGTYMQQHISNFGGYVQNPEAMTDCAYCPISSTNVFLSAVGLSYDRRWRNFGLMWVYIVFNTGMALVIYWWARVPKKPKQTVEEKK